MHRSAHILPLHDAVDGDVGHIIVADLQIGNMALSASFKTVRVYRGEMERTYALCEGWLEGYSAAVKEIKDDLKASRHD